MKRLLKTALASACALALAFGLVAPAWAIPATIFNGFNAAATSQTVTLTGACGAGGAVTMFDYTGGGAIVSGTPTDSKGGSWSNDGSATSASGFREQTWRRSTASAALAIGDTISFTLSGSSGPGVWVGCVADSGANINTTVTPNSATGGATAASTQTTGASAVKAPSPEPAYQIAAVGVSGALNLLSINSGSSTGSWSSLGTVNNGSNIGMAIFYRNAAALDASNNTLVTTTGSTVIWMINWTDIGYGVVAPTVTSTCPNQLLLGEC